MTIRPFVRAILVLPAAGLLGFGGMAFASPGAGLTAAFGNTVKARYPDGRIQRYWFKADGTWDAIGRRGKPSSGKWTAKGEQVCLKQTKPFAAPFKYCTTFPDHGAPGASWAAKSAGGDPIQLSVTKGVERP